MMPGAPPKRRRHSPSLMTATGPFGPPPRTSSAIVKVRPSAAFTPSTVKISPLAISPSTGCVSPSAARLSRSVFQASAPSKAWARSRN